MIQSFAAKDTAHVFARAHVRKFGLKLQPLAQKRLFILDAAESLEDLKVPVGNRHEKLKGNRAGQHNIRINDQWSFLSPWG
jgi:proteic killer suppression protein